MRICADCGIEKSLSKFYKKGKSKRTQEIWYEKRCNECHNLKFRPATGRISSTRFKKGQKPWNKGTKGVSKPNNTSFKPGHVMPNGAGFQKGIPSTGITFKKGNIPWNKYKVDGRNSLEYKAYIKKALERDLYKCKQCASTHVLHVHHIKNWEEYPNLRFDINNVITLCKSCHMKLHKNGHLVSHKTRNKISESLKKRYKEQQWQQ